jgi:DNA polymerase III sliding clamp (beta) subunit (PCNA family)
MATKKKIRPEPPKPEEILMSFCIAQQHFLSMMERCGYAFSSATKETKETSKTTDRVLLRTRTLGENPDGEVSLTAASIPLSVVARSKTEDKTGTMVHYEGACVLVLRDLRTLISAMPNDLLDIMCTKDGKFIIEAAGHADKPKQRTFTVYAIVDENYPPVPPFPVGGDAVRTITGKLLGTAIERVKYASDAASEQDIHSGIMLVLDGSTLESVGTNRSCLARSVLAANFSPPREQMLLPKAMIPLTLLLSASTDKLCMAQDEARIYVETDTTLLGCLKQVGQFPPWKLVIDGVMADVQPICTLDAVQMAEAVRAVSTLFRMSWIDKSKSGGEPVVLEVEGGMLTVGVGFEPGGVKFAGSTEEIEVSDEGLTLKRIVEGHLFVASAMQARGLCKLKSNPKDDMGPVVLESADGAFIGITSPRRV